MPTWNWTAKPLRFWIALSMFIAIAPLAVSAVAGYFILHRGVIEAFHDVSAREREQVAPLQHLRILIWDTLIPVDEFVDGATTGRPESYRALRARIETEFASALVSVAEDPAARILVERASEDWTAADGVATELTSVVRPAGEAVALQQMERFHGLIAAASDTLGEAYGAVAAQIDADHSAAMRAYERATWLAAFAGFLALLAITAGVVLIGRVMAASVDRLVEGAARFADGDRNHRIEVRVPPELRRVAEEFNRMIARIEESEDALSDIARRDSLTRMLNRRAFDEALSDMFAKLRRGGEGGALLMLDLDHFKRINDTYGHSVGDDVLRGLAETASGVLRPFDKVFRVGGEEFAVLLPGASVTVARDVGERIRLAVEGQSIATDKGEIAATVSIGAAVAVAGLRPNELVEAADAALYRAKTGGRNRVVAVDEKGVRDGQADAASGSNVSILRA